MADKEMYHRGWVAQHLKDLLEQQGKTVYTTTVRMQDREAVIAELKKYNPTRKMFPAFSLKATFALEKQ